ncbi:MAG: MFS transporter [Bryobacteraceae bacterium]
MPADPIPAPADKPTHARYHVVVFAVTLAVLSYIDRVSISKAAPFISRDLGLSKSQMGAVFGAFALAYALAEVPSGWMGDKLGARRVLMRIVLWWSCFTASVALMWSFTSLWINQFLFGAGEAGCFPNLTKAFTTWLQPHEKVRAQGIMWMSARWGGAFTPVICYYIFLYLPWRAAFLIFCLLGFLWAFLFFRWFRNDPRDHPGVNEAERKLLEPNRYMTGSHGDVPWARMVGSRTVWLLWIQYFLMTYSWYLYITWLTLYLLEYRKLDERTAAVYAIFPLLFGGCGCVVSGFVLPWIARRLGNMDRARRTLATLGFLSAAVLMFAHIQMQAALPAMLVLGLASFCNDLVMPCAWGTCMDVGGKYAGTLSGSMNMMGNLAGFVSPFLGGIILQHSSHWSFRVFGLRVLPEGVLKFLHQTNGWNLYLYTFVISYILAAACWPLLDSRHTLEVAE